VKVKTVLKVDNIVFNQNLTITLCAGKSTNSCGWFSIFKKFQKYIFLAYLIVDKLKS